MAISSSHTKERQKIETRQSPEKSHDKYEPEKGAIEKKQLTLINIRLHIMKLLILLVRNRVDGSTRPSSQLGIGVLGDTLVGFLGGSGTGALDRL